MKKFYNIILVSIISSNISLAQVYINEIMSSNLSTIIDEDGSYSDWIEIYNSGQESVNLENFSLSDDLNLLDKWQFPEISIGAGRHVLIFASGKNKFDDGVLHINFKIKSSGESIYLSGPDQNLLDSLQAVNLVADVSYGRSPDGSLNFSYFENPTPGEPNGIPENRGLVAELPIFSISSGYVRDNSKSLELSSETGAIIKYTKDGSDPTDYSSTYISSINISSSMVIKARIIEDGKLPGPVLTKSFILQSEVDDLGLPMISISADRDELFGGSGLFNLDPGNLEKQVYFEFFDIQNDAQFSSNAGMKIFGNESGTGYDYQQSLALFARSKYGNGDFNYRLFKEKSIDNFEAFILRNDNGEYNLFDAVGNGLVQDILDVQALQPVVVFLNGEYWGILNMMEKINEHYVAGNFGINPDSVDVLNGFETDNPYYHVDWPIAGDIEAYVELIDFLKNNDLRVIANYEKLKSMIDIDYYATYQIAEIYMANVDWPGNNTKFWREKGENGKWRWIVFDIDAGLAAWADDGFDATYNTLEIATAADGPSNMPWGRESTWPNPPWSTFVLRSLLTSQSFENLFLVTLCNLMSTNFKPEISKQWVDEKADLVIQEIDNHENRWDASGRWYIEENRSTIKNFLDDRREHIIQHFKDFFSLSGVMNALNIDLTQGGSIKLNNQIINQYPFNGEYFQELKLTLYAIPDLGFEFVNWEGVESISPEIEIDMTESKSVNAVFQPIPDFERLVINEFCYYDSLTNDWIEIYNPLDTDVDLSDWKLEDGSNDPFIFPQGRILNAGEYLIICRDIEVFKGQYNISNVIGDFDFGLSRLGGHIFLYNKVDELIDELEYKTVYPWPEDGNSMALFDPKLNNAFYKNWRGTENSKTPGSQNEFLLGAENALVYRDPSQKAKFKIFPNPLSANSQISFELKKDQWVIINLYDLSGRLVNNIIDERLPQGNHTSYINTRGLDVGVYFISMHNIEGSYTSKVLVMH